MTRALLMIAGMVVGFTWGGRLAAQTADAPRERGIAAYDALRYDSAAEVLRHALAVMPAARPPDSVRAATYIYLGAAEHFLGRDTAAARAFDDALRADPRARPDTLIFPPEVGAAFARVRARTSYLAVGAPADTTIVPDTGRYVVRVYVSASRHLRARLTDAAGDARGLYDGPVADSLALWWNGLDGGGNRMTDGRATLELTFGPDGADSTVQLPITLHTDAPDRVAAPSAPPPQRTADGGGGPHVGALAAGVLAGVLVVVLPSFVSGSPHPTPARFALAGALGAAGLVGFVGPSRGAGAPQTAVPTRELRSRERDAVDAMQSRRRRAAPLDIHADWGAANSGAPR